MKYLIVGPEGILYSTFLKGLNFFFWHEIDDIDTKVRVTRTTVSQRYSSKSNTFTSDMNFVMKISFNAEKVWEIKFDTQWVSKKLFTKGKLDQFGVFGKKSIVEIINTYWKMSKSYQGFDRVIF